MNLIAKQIYAETAERVASIIMAGDNQWLPDAEDGQGAGLYEVRADGVAALLAQLDPWMVLQNVLVALGDKDPALAAKLWSAIESQQQ